MKKSKFIESQNVGVLRKVEMGAKVGETSASTVLPKPATNMQQQVRGGLEVWGLAELRELKAENAKLKKMFAELALVRRAF